MRFSVQALAIVVASGAATSAFVVPGAFVKKSPLLAGKNLHEFDYLLGEGNIAPQHQTTPVSRRVILPSTSSQSQKQQQRVQLTSSAAPAASMEETASTEYDEFAEEMEGDYSEEEMSGEVDKIASYQEQSTRSAISEYFAQADIQELAWTLFVPAVVLTIGIKFAYGKLSTKVEGNKDELLDNFAREMLYHDGDFEEMKLCQKDYARKLLWLGPKRNDAMLKRYLETYAKKKTVSPRAIR
jgi:hypothetical protein